MTSAGGGSGFDADVLIIGGGIVGVATAMRLAERHPGLSVLLIEKEAQLAIHQTGHNSGVIHAGVYYAPGSLKADFCRRGAAATFDFAARHGIAVERCGKLIVATHPLELERLDALFQRCEQNRLAPERVDAAALKRLEPNIVGLGAISVPSSGITDYPAITRTMAAIAQSSGVEIRMGVEVLRLREASDRIEAQTAAGSISGRRAIVCGGVMADRLAAMCGVDLDFRIVPFRGEYFRLPPEKNTIVSRLIYPVPDPDLPFLGVHLTRMIDGSVTVGPNAVLALARNGYRWADVNARDLCDMATFPGFWKMAIANLGAAASETRNSLWRPGYLELCRKYCPELTLEDLTSYPSGVRAQAVMRDGALVHDFLIRRSARALHVCNAPSPAATSAIPIAEHLVDQFVELLSET